MSEFSIDGKTYQLVDSGWTFAEARALEKVTGHTFKAISADPDVRDSIDVTQAILWVSMKRVEPETPFSLLNDLAIDAIEWGAEEDDAEADEADPTPPVEAGEPSSR